MKARIAVIDDEQRMLEILEMVLRREGYQVRTFRSAAPLLAALQEEGFDVLLTDLKMPETDGLTVLRKARALVPDLPVVLITAYATVQTAITAMKEGAFDYVQKPFDNDELKATLARALEMSALSRENRYLKAELGQRYLLEGLIAESPRMHEVLDVVRRAARTRSTVLISGESGTGKELVARALHYYSERVGQPFLAVNCKAFAESVLESELFGHEKGSFTGAQAARAGLFERAHGGTVFLDEIGEVSGNFQGKLLRVLQEREVLRVGGTAPRSVDVRVVAATNRDLHAEVQKGSFREDLYFRLAVIPLYIPPLRERPEDIRPLAQHFLARVSTELQRPVRGFSDEVERYLLGHDWPGNVRELLNTVERGVALSAGERIELSDLLISGEKSGAVTTTELQAHLDRATADHVRNILTRTGYSRGEAARLLGIDRTTLYRLMRKHGI